MRQDDRCACSSSLAEKVLPQGEGSAKFSLQSEINIQCIRNMSRIVYLAWYGFGSDMLIPDSGGFLCW